MNKPSRRVRRFFKRKGKGKGKLAGVFLQSLGDHDVDSMFFGGGPKGRGKSQGKRSSGKGKGRRMNPRGADGQPMKCRNCGSVEHFQKECPSKGSGSSGGFHAFTVRDSTEVAGPLSSLPTVSEPDRGVHSIFMMTDDRRSQSSSSHVPTYNMAQSDNKGDPLFENDPWPQAEREFRSVPSSPETTPNVWSNFIGPFVRQQPHQEPHSELLPFLNPSFSASAHVYAQSSQHPISPAPQVPTAPEWANAPAFGHVLGRGSLSGTCFGRWTSEGLQALSEKLLDLVRFSALGRCELRGCSWTEMHLK